MNQTWTRFLPVFMKARLQGRHHLQLVIGNAGWLFADKILRMAMGLVVGAWIARYLGPERFGLLSFAAAFAALFSVMASLGLDGIVIREIVRNPAPKDQILGTAFLLRLFGGAAAVITSVTAVSLLRPGDSLSRWLVGIVAAGTIVQAFDVIDLWFQAQVVSKYTIYARNAAFVSIALVKILLVSIRAPLIAFAVAGLAELFVAAAGMALAYEHRGHALKAWRASAAWAKKLLSDSWPLILSTVSIAVYMKIDQVMLGEMLGNSVVGIYTAATRLSEVWYFIPTAIVSSVFPAIVRTKETDEGLYYRRLQRLFGLMAALSLAIALPMSLLSSYFVVVLYGNGFAAAGPVLAIHIWASLFVFLGVAQGPWDLTENMTRLTMLRIVSGAVLNVVLNLFLIPRHGAVGAAVATVISQAFAAVILNAAHAKTRRIFYSQLNALLFFRYWRNDWNR
jgi:polysaccharide transporter, PST family